MNCEQQRLTEVYKQRATQGKDRRYDRFSDYYLYFCQRRERVLASLLKTFRKTHTSEMKLLEVGCGRGEWLQVFLLWGFHPSNLYGFDLLDYRLLVARRIHPRIHLWQGDARQIPCPNETFDIVFQSTVFTSIPNSEIKAAVAREMSRVVRKDGLIIWNDFRYDNPFNRDVKGIGRREIRQLFPGASYKFVSVNLLPPLARVLAPVSMTLCRCLELLPGVCSHLFAVIVPQRGLVDWRCDG